MFCEYVNKAYKVPHSEVNFIFIVSLGYIRFNMAAGQNLRKK